MAEIQKTLTIQDADKDVEHELSFLPVVGLQVVQPLGKTSLERVSL